MHRTARPAERADKALRWGATVDGSMHGLHACSMGRSCMRRAVGVLRVRGACVQIHVGDVVSVRLESRPVYSFSGLQHDLWVVREIFVDRYVRLRRCVLAAMLPCITHVHLAVCMQVRVSLGCRYPLVAAASAGPCHCRRPFSQNTLCVTALQVCLCMHGEAANIVHTTSGSQLLPYSVPCTSQRRSRGRAAPYLQHRMVEELSLVSQLARDRSSACYMHGT